MDAWLIWLIVAVVLGVAEIFTVAAVLGVMGGAALVTTGVALIGLPAPLQLVAFAVASTFGLVLIRPIAYRHKLEPEPYRFGIDALIGKQALVLEEVSNHNGRVRIDGEEWTARPVDETQVIPVGAAVDVMQISGTTALVYPRE